MKRAKRTPYVENPDERHDYESLVAEFVPFFSVSLANTPIKESPQRYLRDLHQKCQAQPQMSTSVTDHASALPESAFQIPRRTVKPEPENKRRSEGAHFAKQQGIIQQHRSNEETK
jgi:hypothetical protein